MDKWLSNCFLKTEINSSNIWQKTWYLHNIIQAERLSYKLNKFLHSDTTEHIWGIVMFQGQYFDDKLGFLLAQRW